MKAFYPELKQNVELKTRNYVQKYFITKADLLLFVLQHECLEYQNYQSSGGVFKGKVLARN